MPHQAPDDPVIFTKAVTLTRNNSTTESSSVAIDHNSLAPSNDGLVEVQIEL